MVLLPGVSMRAAVVLPVSACSCRPQQRQAHSSLSRAVPSPAGTTAKPWAPAAARVVPGSRMIPLGAGSRKQQWALSATANPSPLLLKQEAPLPERSWIERLMHTLLRAAATVAAAAALFIAALTCPRPAHASSSNGMAGQAPVAQEARTLGYRHTGMVLAAAAAPADPSTDQDSGVEFMDPSTDYADTKRAMEKYMDDAEKRRLFTNKKDKRVKDPEKSVVDDPNTIPTDESDERLAAVRTAWRTDKLKDMTYTQFWLLAREGRVDKVKFTSDGRSAYVTTKANAPGGVRTEKVGLPYDPDLMHHLVEHAVEVQVDEINQMNTLLVAMMRIAFPLWLALYLVKFAFRLGRKKKRDKLFGGVRMEMIQSKDITISFKDVAGIDQVKAEIQEVVAFLQNPKRFIDLGARSPAGVLLVGPPGTGKTLLAKAIAGEAGVPFFSASGTEFMEMFVGVGASRVRDMFTKARKNSPCILFIDEFDGLGKQRSFGGGGMQGNDESVHTINQLLTEMDGFEDNTGVVVMAATNRPASLDNALTRPGRFDRIIHLPLPNLSGRVEIMKVHSRGKKIAEDLDYTKISRATAGYTGAQLMNLMNQAAITAVRQSREVIIEEDVFEALEKINMEKMGRGGETMVHGEDIVPKQMKHQMAIYEASKVIMGCITPHYDELSKVSVCPGGQPTTYSYFIPQEEHLETKIVTRAYMESKIVVLLAGRVGERLVLGDDWISPAGASDLEMANEVCREMIFRMGFSRRLGPVMLMDDTEVFLNTHEPRQIANISTEMARVAREEIGDMMDGAETKAYYGLVKNYKALEALVNRLIEVDSMTGKEVRDLLEENGVERFPDPFVRGYEWTEDGGLVAPNSAPLEASEVFAKPSPENGFPTKDGFAGPAMAPYRVRIDLPDDVFGKHIMEDRKEPTPFYGLPANGNK